MAEKSREDWEAQMEARRKEREEYDFKEWGYHETKLGEFLIDRLAHKEKPKDLFDMWNDRSTEQFNHLASFASRVVRGLEAIESVKEEPDGKTIYKYSYKDKVLLAVVIYNGNYTLLFPCMNDIVDGDLRRYADNPLFPFLNFFRGFDTYIYGPQQGLYSLYFRMLMGYLVYKFPETRDRFLREPKG